MNRFLWPDVLINQANRALDLTDDAALYNVTHDNNDESILGPDGRPIKGRFARGGPFGALIAISLEDGSFEIIGQPRGNNVVGSGIASFHAEDQVMLPDIYRLLKFRLSDLKAGGHDPTVWMITSGQSCTNCHTKQEIMVRELEASGLLNPGHFIKHYGATFDDTFRIAQFYDAQYADAIIFSTTYPHHSANLIKHEHIRFADLSRDLQKSFETAISSTAVVMHRGEKYADGIDTRHEFDLYATAEVNAVRAACRRNRQDGVFASWAVEGELFTTNNEIGPLLFAEAGWTKINVVKTVIMPDHLAHKQFQTRETPKLGNTEFREIIAGGYFDLRSSLIVSRNKLFINKAQPQWAEMLRVNDEQLYNGAAVSPLVESMRDVHTRFRFAAHDICTCSNGTFPHRSLEYLDTLRVQDMRLAAR